MQLDLNLLPILFAIYETKSVGGAALRLGMSQPGLSTALKRARIALDDPLFLRTARGMEPTARTRELIEPIRQILATVEKRVTAPMQFEPAETTLEFCLSMSDVGEAVYLPLILRWFAINAPRATVRSVSFNPRRLEQEMEEGKVDLAIGYFPDFKGGEIFQQTIGSNTFSCMARIGHPIEGDRISLAQFQESGHAVVEVEGRSQEVFEQFLRTEKISRNVILRSSHFMSIAPVIAQTDLLVTVPNVLAEFMLAQGGMKVLKTPFTMPKFVTHLYWHRTSHEDPKSKWLRQALLERIRTLVHFSN